MRDGLVMPVWEPAISRISPEFFLGEIAGLVLLAARGLASRFPIAELQWNDVALVGKHTALHQGQSCALITMVCAGKFSAKDSGALVTRYRAHGLQK